MIVIQLKMKLTVLCVLVVVLVGCMLDRLSVPQEEQEVVIFVVETAFHQYVAGVVHETVSIKEQLVLIANSNVVCAWS